MAKDGVWHNGKKTIKGTWEYFWHSDTFKIVLDSVDRITRRPRTILVKGDHPEWGNWKLERADG